MGLWDHIRARVYDLAPEYEEAFSKSFNKVFPNKGAEKPCCIMKSGPKTPLKNALAFSFIIITQKNGCDTKVVQNARLAA